MKTTLEIPDDLLRRTKAAAALRGMKMKDLVIEALEERLKGKGRAQASGWRTVFGRATRAQVMDIDQRIRRDLERVEPSEWK